MSRERGNSKELCARTGSPRLGEITLGIMTPKDSMAFRNDKNSETPAPVWWWDMAHEQERPHETVLKSAAWADRWDEMTVVGEFSPDVFRVLGVLANQNRPFPPQMAPDCIYRQTNDPLDLGSIPDFINISGGALLVSGAMIDLLSNFDLGATEVIELPYYHGKYVGRHEYSEFHPDRNNPIPGRWGLLHILERKTAFLPDDSKDFRKVGRSSDEPRRWSRNFEGKAVVSLDAHVATAGADLWRDPQLGDFIFFSGALRGAIEGSGLRVQIASEFEKANLIERI